MAIIDPILAENLQNANHDNLWAVLTFFWNTTPAWSIGLIAAVLTYWGIKAIIEAITTH